jgi:hypothetical protein
MKIQMMIMMMVMVMMMMVMMMMMTMTMMMMTMMMMIMIMTIVSVEQRPGWGERMYKPFPNGPSPSPIASQSLTKFKSSGAEGTATM